MTNDILLSKTISYLRFPLTVGVVFIHFDLSKGITIHGCEYGLNNPEWYFHIINFINAFASVCMPLFFMISGFLFFYNKDFNSEEYQKKLKSRAYSLLVPYLLWNLIAIVWRMKCFLPIISSFYRPAEVEFSFVRIFNSFFCDTGTNGIFIGEPYYGPSNGVYPINVPLWYIRDLMAMVIISPAIYWIVKKTNFLFITFIGVLWFLVPSYAYNVTSAFFFFSCGAFCSVNSFDVVEYFQMKKYVPLLYFPILIADVISKDMGYYQYIHRLGIIIGVISVIVIAINMIKSERGKINRTLGNSSIFIFASHYIFIMDLGIGFQSISCARRQSLCDVVIIR